MEDFHREPSQKCDERYEIALNMWTSWTKAQPSITVYPLSESLRQKYKLDHTFKHYGTLKIRKISNLLIFGRGFGADTQDCRLAAMSSFFNNLKELKIIPDEFIEVAESEMLEKDFEVKAVCVNRWDLFTELLKQPQCKGFLAKTCTERVTPEEKVQVAAFWTAFQQNLNCFSRKRKLTVYPDMKLDEVAVKKAREDSSDEDIQVLDNRLAEIFGSGNTTSIESDSNSSVIIDDEGDLAPPEEEMTPNEVSAVDAALQNEEIINFGAYPEYNFTTIKQRSQILKTISPDYYEKAKEAILQHYYINIQDERTLRWKENARRNLEEACKLVFPSARLFAVGSTMNGCGSYNSDMDICAVVSPEELNTKFDRRPQTLDALQKLKPFILRIPSVRRLILIRAVVPILQLSFRGHYDGLEADVNVNNIAGVYNTHLIHHYSRQDERFPALCLLIKHWALNAKINSAQDGTFNSYSIILLVLHYMQCACQPPIMPNLQVACPKVFNGQIAVDQLLFFGDEYKFESDNHSDFTSLLMGFFSYYSSFDFDKYAISIRRGRVFPKEILPPETRKKYSIFIEEPFDHNNTARCVRKEGFEKIKVALADGNRVWNLGRHPTLEKIGVHLPPKK